MDSEKSPAKRIGCFICIFIVAIGFGGWIIYNIYTAQQKEISENQQRDEKIKKTKEQINKFQSLISKYSEISTFSPPEKLVALPYTNGKILFIGNEVNQPHFWGYDYAFINEISDGLEKSEKEKFRKYFQDDINSPSNDFSAKLNKLFSQSLAESSDEIKTIVQISFKETGRTQDYGKFLDINDGHLNLHGISCDVTVIDKTIPAIIGRKSFVNNNFPKEVKIKELKWNAELSIPTLMYPFYDVLNYVKTFQRR